MSHYAEITLKLNGEPEAIVRALCEMEWRTGRKLTREQIEVYAERQNLLGVGGDVRPQKAHLVVRRHNVGGAANDLGLERKADGSYSIHVSDYDRPFYNDAWQKRLLSKWAIQKTGLEAEKRGYRWNVEYQTDAESGKNYAYVHVTR